MKALINGEERNMSKEEIYDMTGIELVSKKCAMEYAREMVENQEWLSDDDSVYIVYKDGSIYSMWDIEEGKFKTTIANIDSIIVCNGGAMMAAGNVEFVDDRGDGAYQVYPR